MIINLSKIKTEALLLFCKDLINSYINEVNTNYEINDELNTYINNLSKEFLIQVTNSTYPNEYYLKNYKNFRIKAVLKSYNYINDLISNEMKELKEFNPTMLFISLLALWFKELNKESKSKEYIFFILYTYTDIYDKLLLNVKDKEFKDLNIKMINLAEKVIFKLDQFSFKS